MLASLIVVFREVLEAGLIVGIVLAATKGVAGRNRWVAGGIAAGVLGEDVRVAGDAAFPLLAHPLNPRLRHLVRTIGMPGEDRQVALAGVADADPAFLAGQLVHQAGQAAHLLHLADLGQEVVQVEAVADRKSVV